MGGALTPIPTKLELPLSLCTDWCNPLSNKSTGKQVSPGVPALNCLNPPPTSRWKMHHTLLSDMVPEPTQPNMVTINNILRIFIERIAPLDSGIMLQTPQYPQFHKVVVLMGCLIVDLVANKNISGFSSHSTT
ncbi:hypothetical protein O181_012632 [Austropuccinia psidii MF-1]|uniref:Uncharacterized protein n=1 Tax=Austropuccinia psidii MF-1 TaxID=1389203 RepID=A0A9Q3GN73_9BASI|nr:hypothetical protein [Austropuccinia psidii MF-1]